MSMPSALPIDLVVEGPLDEAVLRVLIARAGGRAGRVYGLRGKSDVERRISGVCAASALSPWVILLDLDRNAYCAADYLRQLVGDRPTGTLCIRVAVRAIEAWLLADAERLAGILSVSQDLLPSDPDKVLDPKRVLVQIATRSPDRSTRDDMVPSAQGGRTQGPGYNNVLIGFVKAARNGWRPHIARRRSASLDSCMKCLARLIRSGQQ
jgi:hypothetical protein